MAELAVASPGTLATFNDVDGRGLTAPGKLARLPALDGIRGLGIPLVLLYHHGLAIFGIKFGGGFLTVSMFFTLSGFLITRLLLQEFGRAGSIALKQFYARRIRRLMPAALAVFTLVALFWAVFPGSTRSLTVRSMFWAIFYGTNISLISQGNSYQDLFADRSPLQHTWSLSLEEQIYIIFPLALVLILRSARVRRHAAAVLAATGVLSFAAAWWWSMSSGNTRAYYATEARAGEFLFGAAFAAFWLASTRVPAIAAFIRSTTGRLAGLAFLAAEVLLWVSVDLNTSWLFRGGTLINAVLVCTVMGYASAEPNRGVARLLSNPWLMSLGQRAYTIYLVHWPVFIFVDRASTGLSSPLLFALRVGITGIISETIYRFFETPILQSKLWAGRRLARGCLLLVCGALIMAAFAPQPRVGQLIDSEALALQQQALEALPQVAADAPAASLIDPTLPARVLVVGDSQSYFVGTGMAQMWGVPFGVDVQQSAGVGCGTAPITPMQYLGSDFPLGRPGCREWLEALPRILQRFQPQVVVIVGGLADLSNRTINGSDQHIGQPAYDLWLQTGMSDFATKMGVTGAKVLWLTHPHVDPPNPPDIDQYPEEEHIRMDRYNELITQLAATDQNVFTADLAAVVANRPGGEFSRTFRPDGSHMLLTEAQDVVDFIAQAIRITNSGE